jgi:N-acetylglutamate synthase-like GNAT family acetyltransferase
MKVREMRAEDRPAVLDLLEHSFHLRELFERYMDFDAAFAYGDFLLAEDGARVVACVQVFAKTIHLRGHSVRLGGIGSVATHESCRGRGLSSQLLVQTIERMRRREMALSLLFAGQAAPLYERHGWHKVPLALIRLRARGARPPGDAGRPFRASDLARVRDLYDLYAGRLSGPTLRDERYWRGQLRTAGTPEEDFRVAERDGRIAAYSRAANFGGRTRVLEYGCEPGRESALADLLIAQTAAPNALPISDACDSALAAELEARGFELSRVDDTSALWRVLDRNALARIAGLEAETPDLELLETLLKTGSVTYWPSDRF